jgi:DNA-binding CsgD family transcriptional regulator
VRQDIIGRTSGTTGPRQPDESFAAAGPCPACGTILVPGRDQRPAAVTLRAMAPQPVAAALLAERTLSPRERTVFHLLGLGHGNRSIARELNVSERTVKRHVTAILTKLSLESRLQAGLAALIFSTVSPNGATWPEGRMDLAMAADDTT